MKPTVIVVEDELLIAMDIKEILEEDDFEVIIDVVCVEDAIEMIEKHKPVLVLIDINLNQNKDGIDLGSYLLEKDGIPFIYITSYSDKATIDRVKATRPYGFLVKPFRPHDIKTTVSLVLNNFKHRKIDILRDETKLTNDIPFRIKQTVNYINSHLSEKIEISDLARIARWQNEHFIRMFTKYLNITPYQYVLKVKIEKSKVMLSESSIPIVDIAFELGFQSYGNFCNAFKQVTNETPENYKKRVAAHKFL